MLFTIHPHESATGTHVFPHPELPSHLPPHLIPLGCPRAPALGALLHASNLHWSSVSRMVIHMFQCYSLKPSHPRLLQVSPSESALYICVSPATLHVGSSIPSLEIPYVCINIQYLCFSFWLTPLCIIGSRFTYLIRIDSNVFFFTAE